MNTDIAGKCWHCAREMTTAYFGREADCPGCGKPTRVCRNCRHFAPGRPNDCIEPMAERVLDKKRANFCEFFDPTEQPVTDKRTAVPDLLQNAEDLFK